MALPQESGGRLESAGAEVLYTGVGKVNAAATLARRLAEIRAAGGEARVPANHAAVARDVRGVHPEFDAQSATLPDVKTRVRGDVHRIIRAVKAERAGDATRGEGSATGQKSIKATDDFLRSVVTGPPCHQAAWG